MRGKRILSLLGDASNARRLWDVVRRATLFCDEENRNSEENYAHDSERAEPAAGIHECVAKE